MGEPLGLQEMFFSTMAGAAIVLMGALYALFFALGRLRTSRSLNIAALLAYALLAVAVYVLINALALSGFWILVTTVMLVGYFFLPRAIWHLCVGTHGDDTATTHSRATSMNDIPWWSSESFWRKMAIWVTAGMAVVLIGLTFDTVRQITAGGERVPAYSVINQKIFYEYRRRARLPGAAHRGDRLRCSATRWTKPTQKRWSLSAS